MMRTGIEQADRSVAKAVAPARKTKAVKTLGWLSEIADQPQLITLCAGVLAVGLVTRNGRLTRSGARMLASELLATKMKGVVKHRVDRTRPCVVEDGRSYAMRRGGSHQSELNSFPSGHTAGAVAVARALAREYSAARGAAYVAATAVAAIQIPRCRHYPSDLAAGALIGLAAEAIVDGLGALGRRGDAE